MRNGSIVPVTDNACKFDNVYETACKCALDVVLCMVQLLVISRIYQVARMLDVRI